MIRGTENMDHRVEVVDASPGHGRAGRRVLLTLIALGLAAAAFSVYPTMSRWASSDRSVDAAELRLAQVTRGDLERDVSAEGRVVAARRPTLSSPADGIVHLQAQPGEAVAAGDVLATVDSPELRSRLEQERSTFLALESEVERRRLAERENAAQSAQEIELLTVRRDAARRALDRAQRNFREGVVSEVELERARDALEIARLELEHAERGALTGAERLAFERRQEEHRVERQRLVVAEFERRVEELAVRSPVAGLLAAVEVVDRDTVRAGQALFTVVDLSALEVEVAVPDVYAAEIEVGMAAELRVGGDALAATVRRVAPQVEGTTVPVRIAFDAPPDGLRQSQRVTARLVLDARRDVLKLRRGSFLEEGGGKRAWVVGEDGLARPRRIEVGAMSVAEVEIRAGLEEGERVVLSGTQRFHDADTVLIRQ